MKAKVIKFANIAGRASIRRLKPDLVGAGAASQRLIDQAYAVERAATALTELAPKLGLAREIEKKFFADLLDGAAFLRRYGEALR